MLNPTNQSLLYSPGCQTLWVCSDLTRSSSWTHSCLHYFTWHLISRSFLTCPNPSYSRSALLTSSLCLFSSIQEGELFLYLFSLSPWPVLGFAEIKLSLLLWSRFGNPLTGMNWDTWNLNLQTSYLLSHTVQALRERKSGCSDGYKAIIIAVVGSVESGFGLPLCSTSSGAI